MAWWNTKLTFRDDTLIAEGIDPVLTDDVEVVEEIKPTSAPESDIESYTQVTVSGYALYGKLRGYYALGVAHVELVRPAGRAYMSAASLRTSEPVSTLTPVQRTTIRECLIQFSDEAWSASNFSFRKQLDA